MIVRMLALAACLGAVSCGVVYNPTAVRRDAPGVRVLPLTAESVLAANRDGYTPRQLPEAFSALVGGVPVAQAGGLAPPPAPLSPVVRPSRPQLIPPPPAQPAPFEIGVGDVLLISTTRSGSTVAELSGLLAAANARQGYRVREDGAISIPDVGQVAVAGLTVDEAEAALFQALITAQIDPAFTLEVGEVNSSRVAIGGAVGSASILPVPPGGLTLVEAVTASGGIAADDSDYAVIRIYRDGRLYQIPLNDYLRRPELQRTTLLANDTIYVGDDYDLERAQAYFNQQLQLIGFRQGQQAQVQQRLQAAVDLRRSQIEEVRSNFQTAQGLGAVERDYVFLAGEVNSQGQFELPFERHVSLAQVLYGAGGGFNVLNGNPGQIYVLRPSDDPADLGAVTAWHLDARNAANLTVATRMQMRPNDFVYISEQPITRWNRVLSQLTPNFGLAQQLGSAVGN